MKLKRLAAAAAAAGAALLGAALLAQTQVFRFDGVLSRIISPNGDGRNDTAIFCFDNFADSEVDGRIYTLLGSEVAKLSRVRAGLAGCPGGLGPQHMIWDPRSSGAVRSGVYVYQIKSEGRAFSGTLVVVR